MKKVSKSLKDTEKLAGDFLKKIYKKSKGKAVVVGLSGDLGAGKTAFTQFLAKHLGIKEKVVSPTFVIMKKFKIPQSRIKDKGSKMTQLIHLDAYRLKKGEELAKLGWADVISDPNNLVLIEWPENVADVMPDQHLKIKIKHIDEKSREFGFCFE